MGYYIETDYHKNKAEWLKNNAGGIFIAGMPATQQEGYVPVCVVDNGPFEAAAIAYTKHEAGVFNRDYDPRPKQWLIIPIAEAERLCPRVVGKIDWSE